MCIHNQIFRTALLVGSFILASAGLVEGQTYARHEGATHPAINGWSGLGSAGVSNVTYAPITNDDAGTGEYDAWQVHDNSSDARPNSVRPLSFDEVDDLNENGWILRTRLRVVDDGSNNLSRIVQYQDSYASGKQYNMVFGTQEIRGKHYPKIFLRDGDDSSNQKVAIVRNNLEGYHLYELVYDPSSEDTELFIDGETRAQGYVGVPGADDNVIRWGSLSAGATGEANYNLVELSVVPEPTSAALLGLGMGGLLLKRRRSPRG